MKKPRKQHIIEALRQTGHNKSRAAVLLGIDRKTLYNKLKLYGIDVRGAHNDQWLMIND